MKSFAKRLLALVSAAAITLTTLPVIHAANTTPASITPVSQWSMPVSGTTDAAPLTRKDLCIQIMDSYRALTGLTNDDLGEPIRVFTDTDSTDVLYACQLDLIEGKVPGIFAPCGIVSREEFWVAAANLLELLGYPCSNENSPDLRVCEDSTSVSDHTAQSVEILLSIEAIAADADSTLNSDGTITAVEAEQTLQQIAAAYTSWLTPPRFLGEEVAEYALNYVGCRYVRGGQGPNKFDCSGFVYYVYKHFGYKLNPGARNQWSLLDNTIEKSDLLPGDLVFFSNNGRSSGIFHVGIYIGNDQFVHAANSRKGLIVTDMDDDWYSRRYLGAKRAIEA